MPCSWLKHLTCVIWALTLPQILWAKALTSSDYPEQLTFQNIMAQRDIALGEVEAIIQDSDGFIWLGGRNALLRYDGYDMLEIPIMEDRNDLSKNHSTIQVTDIFEDSRKDIWVATRGGLFRYNKNLEVLERLKQQNGEQTQLYNDTVNRIAEAPSGEILTAAYNGLNVIDPNTLNIVASFLHDTSNPSSIPHNSVYEIFVDINEQVWVGTDVGISRIQWGSNTFETFLPYPENPDSIPDNRIFHIAKDLHDNFWLGTRAKGVYRFNPVTETFTRYEHDSNDPTSIGGNITMDIMVDTKGRVWTGSDEGGISLFNEVEDNFIRFQANSTQAGALISNVIRSIFEDHNGDLWVGTYPQGVHFHDKSTAAIQYFVADYNSENSLVNNHVGGVHEDEKGNFWIGTGGGISYYNRSKKRFKNYTKSEGQLVSDALITAFLDEDGDYWYGTWAASFHKFIPSEDRFVQMPFDASLATTEKKHLSVLNDSVVWGFCQGDSGNIWIGTHNGGLSQYNKMTGQYIHYKSIPDKVDSLSNQLVWACLKDSKGRFWVGTASGLNILDRTTGTFKRYMPDAGHANSLANASVISMYEDTKGRMWFGTDSGLHLYRESTDDFEVFTKEDGFVDHGIRSITSDHDGNLWLGTNNGIVMFNPETRHIKNFKQYAGQKIGGFTTGTILTTRKGEIALGSMNGLYLIDPKKLSSNTLPPPVVFTDFKIFARSVSPLKENRILPRAINRADEIVLHHSQNMFSFYFSALNYRDSEKNQYAYMLEGFDKEWRQVGGQRKAQYTNLNAGNYVFRVKASNNDGIWNDEGKFIRIKQLPPPWLSWWAYSLYAFSVLAIITQFIRSQTQKRKRVEEQNRLLEQKVAERTADLEQKNQDIQAMLGNMRQGLFTIQADGSIHPEYSGYLESIFEIKNIAGENGVELLFQNAMMGGNSLDQNRQAVASIIGEHTMCFDFNSHLLINEYPTQIGGKIKHLTLDWNPISEKNKVTKLMVSVRDVTQLKEIETDAENKKRELEIISQLINVSSQKFQNFYNSTKKFIQKNKALIEQNSAIDSNTLAHLFRNMHTVKGNCRTFNFKHLSDLAHELESAYSENTRQPVVQQTLLQDLGRLDSALEEYQHIYNEVLGRKNSDSREQQGFWLGNKGIQAITNCIHRVEQKHPQVQTQNELSPIKQTLNEGLSSAFPEAIADVLNSLPSLAEELNKAVPNVEINNQQIRVRENARDLINDVFAHILRNCLDHGIEEPSARSEAGKPINGSITIELTAHDQQVSMQVKDDGQGLNIERLWKKALELGYWQNNAKVQYKHIAALVFESGVSSKEAISTISGRGVGMDAVKQFLVDQGGSIEIYMAKNEDFYHPSSQAFEPFLLKLSLPLELFYVSKPG